MWVATFQPLQIHNLVTQLQLLLNIELHCCQWLILLVRWNRYRHYFRLDILWSVDSRYWKKRLTVLQLQCRYNWLVHEWGWGSRITHCQHAQAVVSIHQFYTHYRESSLCDVCCYCCCSIQGSCCSLPLWEVTVQKLVVSLSTIGYTASCTRQSKHSLNFCTCSRRSFSFIDLYFSQPQIACCSSLNGQSEFFAFVESSALDAKAFF